MALILVGCSRPTNGSSYTNTDIPLKVTDTEVLPTSTLSSNSVVDISLDALEPGQYIVYDAVYHTGPDNGTATGLFVMDLEGNIRGKLVSDVGRSDISNNGKMIVTERYVASERTYKLVIIDLISGEEKDIKEGIDCVIPSWAPNDDYIVATCDEFNLHAFSLEEDTDKVIDDCDSRKGSCGNAVWSPDGKYIVYEFVRLFTDENGVFAIDTRCIYENIACEPFRVGTTLNFGGYTWSPDSKYIAAPNYQESIAIISFPSGSIELLEFIPGSTVQSSMAWSPDGGYLAVTEETYGSNQIFLVYVNDGSYKKVGDDVNTKKVQFWLNVE